MSTPVATLRTLILASTAEPTVALYREPAVATGASDPAQLNCVTLYGNGGPAQTQDFSGNTYGPDSVQVRVRDASAQSLETRTEALWQLFRVAKLWQSYYLFVETVGRPLYSYPRQDTGAYVASFNLRVYQGG